MGRVHSTRPIFSVFFYGLRKSCTIMNFTKGNIFRKTYEDTMHQQAILYCIGHSSS